MCPTNYKLVTIGTTPANILADKLQHFIRKSFFLQFSKTLIEVSSRQVKNKIKQCCSMKIFFEFLVELTTLSPLSTRFLWKTKNKIKVKTNC